jgi:hypothetical protein
MVHFAEALAADFFSSLREIGAQSDLPKNKYWRLNASRNEYEFNIEFNFKVRNIAQLLEVPKVLVSTK